MEAQDKLSDRQVFSRRARSSCCWKRPTPLAPGLVGQGPATDTIKRIARQIETTEFEIAEIDTRLQLTESVLRFLVARCNDNRQARSYLELRFIATVFRQPAFDIRIISLGHIERCGRSINYFSILRGEFATTFRVACLNENRVSLNGTWQIEKSIRLQMLTLEMHRMCRGRAVEPALLTIRVVEGVIVPGVPQRFRQINELTGTIITIITIPLICQPEVLRGVRRQ